MTPASDAVIVTDVCCVTPLCVILKVAVAFPAGIVTVAGVAAAFALELLKAITKPPVGATPESVTVPVTAVVALPLTDAGAIVTDTRVGVWIVRPACFELVPSVAVIVAGVDEVTAVVVMLKIPVVRPTPTDAVAGTTANLELDASLTKTAPLFELGVAFKVTFPITLFPPMTFVGFKVRAVTKNGLTLRTADRELPPAVTVIVTF